MYNEGKVSIIVPVYNAENFLHRTVDSILAQTYENWELCIADGSGKEESLEKIVSQYAAKDSRIRYQLLDKNEGISGK